MNVAAIALALALPLAAVGLYLVMTFVALALPLIHFHRHRQQGHPARAHVRQHPAMRLEGPTQLGRALEAAAIAWLVVRSPEARGRVERLWGTAQDRLVIELRGGRDDAGGTTTSPRTKAGSSVSENGWMP